MAKGPRKKVQRPVERPRKSRLPQNLRSAPGAFDPTKSRVKAVQDWDDTDLQDEEDEFIEGKDKVLLEHRAADDSGDLDLPDEVFAVDGEESPNEDEDAEIEEFEPRRKQRKSKKADTAPKGRFAKPLRHEEDEVESNEEEDDSDLSDPALDTKTKGVSSSSSDSDSDASSDPDAEAWGSYHVSSRASKRGKGRVDEVDPTEEEENKKLELAEALRLQKRARARLTEKDFLPYGGAWQPPQPASKEDEEEGATVLMGTGGGIDAEALRKEPLKFDSEADAISYLLRERPECLALIDDFRRQVSVLRRAEEHLTGWEELKRMQTEGEGGKDVNESIEAFRWMHYHTLSTYLSCVAFYFRVLLTSPPDALSSPSSLANRVTNTLVTLRKTLADLEDQGLTGDEDDEDEATVPVGSDEAEELEAVQSFLKKNGYPSGLGDLEEDELEELLAGALSREDEPPKGKVSAAKKAATKINGEKRKKRSKKDKVAINGDIHPDDLLVLQPRPAVQLPPEDPTASLDDDFLDPLALSAGDVADKSSKRKALRFHTSKIAAKQRRREAATGVGQGDEDVVYKSREERRREALKKQKHARGEEVEGGKAKVEKRKRGEEEGEGGYYDVIKELKDSAKKAKKAKYDEQRLAERDILSTEAESNGPRAASRQILANKGLTPKRNKLDRNPRVKKRKRYEKAQKRVASQRSVYKSGEAQKGRSGGYEGEKTGIRSGVVKSRKL